MFHLTRRLRLSALLILLLGSGAVVLGLSRSDGARAALPTANPVEQAWQQAAEASYAFHTDVREEVEPLPLVVNAGAGPVQRTYSLWGQADGPDQRLEITVADASRTQQESLRVEDGVVYRRSPDGEWIEGETLTPSALPDGDLLAFLAGVRAVERVAPSAEPVADPFQPRAGIGDLNHYRFRFDGPQFARYMQRRLQSELVASGQLPPGVQIQLPALYAGMQGDGEIWIDTDGYPVRLILDLQMPPTETDQTRIQLKTDFRDFRTPDNVWAFSDGEALWGEARRLPTLIQESFLGVILDVLGVGLLLSVALGIVVYRRRRWVHVQIVGAVLLSMLVGPLLHSFQIARFSDRVMAAGSPVAPNTAVMPRPEAARQPADLETVLAQTQPDASTDTDGDGLSDLAEEALGTQPQLADSDADGIPDGVEVEGFVYGDQTWYTNPSDLDSNGDGLTDGQECPDRATDHAAICPDTDNDGTPDIFDWDNDGDGVPDDVDPSPFWSMGASTPFDAENQLALGVNGLLSNHAPHPVFVDFQIRPVNEDHLWWAQNVLDWPSGDEQGQVQRRSGNDTTFADLYAEGAAPSDANGDMRLVPLLEIEIPYVEGSYGNLPIKPDAPAPTPHNLDAWLDRDALTPYGISVRYKDDAGTLLVYVPLNVQMDSLGGAKVAFRARMLYRPAPTSGLPTDWGAYHQVRLLWTVQALVDRCVPNADDVVNHDDPNACANGRGTWRMNESQVIQTYADAWLLTGLSVEEHQGMSVAVAYENPARFTPMQDGLWQLSRGLRDTFLAGRDAEPKDGQRDVTVDEIQRRFDSGHNSGVSVDQR